MDPYLEAHWRDVHAGLVVYTSDSIQVHLPPSLRSRINERVLVEPPTDTCSCSTYPERKLVKNTAQRGRRVQLEEAFMAEPILVETEFEPVTETFIEIIDRESGNRVVTVIEYLSPSNKLPGPNREQYLRKQREICSSDANLVEINLNRFGLHTLAFPLEHLKRQDCTPYMVCVRRVTRPGKAEVYPMPLWERLPTVKIPLRPDDADVSLDLQAVVAQCYRNGAYEGTLNYAADPDPPLLGSEAKWAGKWLRDKGLRPRKKPGRGKGK
jgi:hypothetical protein